MMLCFEIVMVFVIGVIISYKAKIILDKKLQKETNEEIIELRNANNSEN